MITIEWDDIDIVATFVFEGSVTVNFACYEIVAREADKNGEFTIHVFVTEGPQDRRRDMREAKPLIRGCIGWDACSHVYFGEEDGYIHMCGKETWIQVTECLSRVFKQAGEMLVEEGFNEEYF